MKAKKTASDAGFGTFYDEFERAGKVSELGGIDGLRALWRHLVDAYGEDLSVDDIDVDSLCHLYAVDTPAVIAQLYDVPNRDVVPFLEQNGLFVAKLPDGRILYQTL